MAAVCVAVVVAVAAAVVVNRSGDTMDTMVISSLELFRGGEGALMLVCPTPPHRLSVVVLRSTTHRSRLVDFGVYTEASIEFQAAINLHKELFVLDRAIVCV